MTSQAVSEDVRMLQGIAAESSSILGVGRQQPVEAGAGMTSTMLTPRRSESSKAVCLRIGTTSFAEVAEMRRASPEIDIERNSLGMAGLTTATGRTMLGANARRRTHRAG